MPAEPELFALQGTLEPQEPLDLVNRCLRKSLTFPPTTAGAHIQHGLYHSELRVPVSRAQKMT